MNKRLHIVCLEAPSPPDYGGAIEMYCKIKALAELGIAITLHYFDYKPGRGAEDLKKYCTQIFSYKRKSFLQTLTFSKPHIVASRINRSLIDRLNADDHPILLEGVHCTGIIPYLKNKNRKIIVRLHNDEAVYYRQLAKAETNFFKRAYYKRESKRLEHYQKQLPGFATYAALSNEDVESFRSKYHLKHAFFLPAFVPWQQVTSLTGGGRYCLYHGNLSIAENKAAANWLIKNVFSRIDMPLVIAGKNISPDLIKTTRAFQNISFHSNPTEAELTSFVQEAHVHVIPDYNKTGVKLKLLHALFQGRFCITDNTELEPSRTFAVARTAEDYMRILKSFSAQHFTESDIADRRETLRLYNNQLNAEKLKAHLW